MTDYVVYALKDPKNKCPFYIGMGGIRRAFDHFPTGYQNAGDVSCMDSIEQGNENNDANNMAKTTKINQLLQSGCAPHDICRVIARYFSQQQAFAIESHLIDHYGLKDLTNVQPGHHAGSFLLKDQKFCSRDAINKQVIGKHHVYALVDPRTGQPFYIGKGGVGNERCFDHFREAERGTSSKHRTIQQFRELGFDDHQMVRILFCPTDDRYNTDDVALAVESVMIVFTYGEGKLTNRVEGRSGRNLRPHDDWKKLRGFDSQRILLPAGADGIRKDEFEAAKARLPGKLVARAYEVVQANNVFGNVNLSPVKYDDSGDVAFYISSSSDQMIPARLKIFGRKNGLKSEIRRKGDGAKSKKIYMEHFKANNCEHFLRNDMVLYPQGWIQQNVRNFENDQNISPDEYIDSLVEVGLARARILWELLCIRNGDKPSDELSAFLNDKSHDRRN
jgi:hypothetical protein